MANQLLFHSKTLNPFQVALCKTEDDYGRVDNMLNFEEELFEESFFKTLVKC